MEKPLVSCIMPTANREKYIPFAIKHFLSQDYNNSELIIIDDGKQPIQHLIPNYHNVHYYYYINPLGSIGAKRNLACEKANGDIIIHWDDDDWFAKNWISNQVYFLITSGADIAGIEHVNFFSAITDTLWLGTNLNRNNPANLNQWVNGATLVYWKSFWTNHKFLDVSEGEDDNFILNTGARVFAHDYIDGFVALLHSTNTTSKYFENPIHKKRHNNL